jgi:D-serine deaminase-like pyridoxal phosphate-dependent protein
VGKLRIADLETPVLLLDLDCMHSNLQIMAEYFLCTTAKLRPHFKNHQVLSLAARQIEAGATGITCARLDHAEALVQHGITNILVANEIAGESMIRQFVDLSRRAPVIIAVDNPKIVSDMARIAGGRAHELNVVVDLDVGLRRCGVSSAEAALSLTNIVMREGLRFRGLMGYGGNLRIATGPEKASSVRALLKPLLDAKALIEDAGIAVEIVSCGSTGDYSITATFPGVTEIQAGSYLLMDTGYAPFAPEFSRALTVLATVVSKTASERVVVDAGLKALGFDKDMPMVKGNLDLRVRTIHAEHAILDIMDQSFSIEVGDKIEIWIQCLDSAIQLHQRMYGLRNNQVEETFEIER